MYFGLEVWKTLGCTVEIHSGEREIIWWAFRKNQECVFKLRSYFFFFHSRIFSWTLGLNNLLQIIRIFRERLQRKGTEQFLAYGMWNRIMQQENNLASPFLLRASPPFTHCSLSPRSRLIHPEYRRFCKTGLQEERDNGGRYTERKRAEWSRRLCHYFPLKEKRVHIRDVAAASRADLILSPC